MSRASAPSSRGEQRRGEVLVDHRVDAGERAAAPHHGHAAAARADDEGAGLGEVAHGLELDDLPGLGAGHDAAPAAARVLAHGEALLEHHLPRLGLGVEGADRLGGRGEGLVLGVDGHLGDDGHHRHLELALAQVVGQRLRRHVADLALALGAADVHRHRRHRLGGERVLDQQVADLGAVAVREHDPPAVLDELRDAAHGAVDVEQLLLEGADLAGLEDGVAAEGDDDGLAVLLAGCCHRCPSILARRSPGPRPLRRSCGWSASRATSL